MPLVCGQCGRETRKAEAYLDGLPVCSACYKREFHPVICTTCGRPTRVQGEHPALCKRCRPKDPCIRCGKPTAVHSFRVPEGPVCSRCKPNYVTPKVCPSCGKLSRRLGRSTRLCFDIPVCPSCQSADFKTCSRCGHYRFPVDTTPEGKPLCRQCVDTPIFICPACGNAGRRHSASRCSACYYRDVIRENVRTHAEGLRTQWCREALLAYGDYLIEHESADGGLVWRCRGSLAFFSLLDRTFRTRIQLTAESLFNLTGRDGARKYELVHRFLVDACYVAMLPDDLRDALTNRDVQSRLMARVPVGWKQQLLHRYLAHLNRVMAIYRARGWSGKDERFKPRTVTLLLRAGWKFLESLPSEVMAAQGIDRTHLDLFVANKRGHRNALHSFIAYLNRFENLFQQLHIERNGWRDFPHHLLLPIARSDELLAAWLNPAEAELRLALSGLLMLVYARTATQVAQLRREHFTVAATGTVTCKFGPVPIELAPEIAAVLSRYVAQRETKLNRPMLMEDYLFPGRVPGRPLDTGTLMFHLRRVGVTAEQLYTTALANFYRNGLSKPKILVRTLGISDKTAIDYWQVFAPRVSQELAQRAGRR